MIDIRALPNLSIEQKDFVNRFYAAFDYAAAGSGLNRHIANIEPLLFEGAIGGSEFVVYAATKLYLCFSLVTSFDNIASIINDYIVYYNENNVVMLYSQNQSITYDSVAPAIFYATNTLDKKNLWFSRFLNNKSNYMKFIGYRITLD